MSSSTSAGCSAAARVPHCDHSDTRPPHAPRCGMHSSSDPFAARGLLPAGRQERRDIMNTVTTRATTTDGLWARGLNAVLGLWLIISAYLWPHITGQVT